MHPPVRAERLWRTGDLLQGTRGLQGSPTHLLFQVRHRLIVHPRVLSARDPAPAQFLLLRTSLLASGRKSPSAGIQDGQEPGP